MSSDQENRSSGIVQTFLWFEQQKIPKPQKMYQRSVLIIPGSPFTFVKFPLWTREKHRGFQYSKYTNTYLKPIDGTAVNKRWKLPQAVSKGISNRTEGHHNVKVLSAACHKECKKSQRTQLQILVSTLGNGTYRLKEREIK